MRVLKSTKNCTKINFHDGDIFSSKSINEDLINYFKQLSKLIGYDFNNFFIDYNYTNPPHHNCLYNKR